MKTLSFDEHYRSGWAILKTVMKLASPAVVSAADTLEAERAIGHFRVCLSLEPHSWQSIWAIGKAEQAVGHHQQALDAFEKATNLVAENADVWREAAIEACALGAAAKAAKYAVTAISLCPDDAGLHANAALAYLLAGEDDRAEQLARTAIRKDPKDIKNSAVLKLVIDVRNGRRPRPPSI